MPAGKHQSLQRCIPTSQTHGGLSCSSADLASPTSPVLPLAVKYTFSLANSNPHRNFPWQISHSLGISKLMRSLLKLRSLFQNSFTQFSFRASFRGNQTYHSLSSFSNFLKSWCKRPWPHNPCILNACKASSLQMTLPSSAVGLRCSPLLPRLYWLLDVLVAKLEEHFPEQLCLCGNLLPWYSVQSLTFQMSRDFQKLGSSAGGTQPSGTFHTAPGKSGRFLSVHFSSTTLNLSEPFHDRLHIYRVFLI